MVNLTGNHQILTSSLFRAPSSAPARGPKSVATVHSQLHRQRRRLKVLRGLLSSLVRFASGSVSNNWPSLGKESRSTDFNAHNICCIMIISTRIKHINASQGPSHSLIASHVSSIITALINTLQGFFYHSCGTYYSSLYY